VPSGAARAQVKHNCAFCHDLHGGSYTALRDTAVVEDLCLSCHGPAGPATVNRDGDDVPVPKDVNIHNGSKHSQPTNCWDCHDHESQAGSNLFMIPTTVATPNSGDK
jgi:predicted CXXCH cytochrome family protein